MTPKSLWTPLAPLACALMTAACANSRPTSAPGPIPRLPESVRTPCRLPRLPEAPTLADLDAAYMDRGAALAECEASRRQAVAAFEALASVSSR